MRSINCCSLLRSALRLSLRLAELRLPAAGGIALPPRLPLRLRAALAALRHLVEEGRHPHALTELLGLGRADLELIAAAAAFALLLTLLGEGVIEQLLLVGRHLVEVLHRLLGLLLLGVLGRRAGLQPLEKIVEFRQHALGHLFGARLGEVLDALQHLVEILLRHEILAGLGLLRRGGAFVLLLGQRLEIALQRGAQLLHLGLDLLGRGVVAERLQ